MENRMFKTKKTKMFNITIKKIGASILCNSEELSLNIFRETKKEAYKRAEELMQEYDSSYHYFVKQII